MTIDTVCVPIVNVETKRRVPGASQQSDPLATLLRPPPHQVISYLPAPPSTRSLAHRTLPSAPKLTSKSVMPNGFAPNT